MYYNILCVLVNAYTSTLLSRAYKLLTNCIIIIIIIITIIIITIITIIITLIFVVITILSSLLLRC
jgi:hypothetical protein